MHNLFITSRKIPTLAIIAILTAALFSSSFIIPALAKPTLHGTFTCQIVSLFRLQCTITEVSGLGGATTATGTLKATANVSTGCINQGSQDQQPSGLKRTTTTVTGTQTVNVNGGKATFTITTEPIIAEQVRKCPDQMTPVVTCVFYSNISLQVVPNSGPSATFSYPGGNVGSCPPIKKGA